MPLIISAERIEQIRSDDSGIRTELIRSDDSGQSRSMNGTDQMLHLSLKHVKPVKGVFCQEKLFDQFPSLRSGSVKVFFADPLFQGVQDQKKKIFNRIVIAERISCYINNGVSGMTKCGGSFFVKVKVK